MTARWASTVRLAWRLVRRSPARSLLVATLVAIPVLAGTFAAVTIRTGQLSPDEAAARNLGRADAVALVTAQRTLDPAVSAIGRSGSGDTATSIGPGPGPQDARRHAQLRRGWQDRLPAGSHVTPGGWGRSQRLTVGDRSATVGAVALDLADPLTAGIYSRVTGTAPAAHDEVAVTTHLAGRLHIAVGDTVSLPGNSVTTATVREIVRNPRALSADEVVAPLDTWGGARTFDFEVGTWLIDTPDAAPDLHNALAATGVIYETRQQWAHPGPAMASHTSVNVQILLVLGTVAGFGLLEVLLLAGTAFAVGARRQSHDLGLLAVCGGDETDIRRAVLAQGLVLGCAGAVGGVAGGIAAVFFGRPVLEHLADRAFGGLDVRLPDVASVVVLGLVAGLLAAVFPARMAARRPVLDMLRNRFPGDGGGTRNPRWATAAVLAGPLMVVGSAWAWRHVHEGFQSSYVQIGSVRDLLPGVSSAIRENPWAAGVWLGSAITLAGLVRSCPAVIARLGGLASRLPLTARLALRDASRHRHRTAPATAAVMTVLAVASVVMFVVSSTEVRDRKAYGPSVPIGSLSITVHDDNATTLTTAVTRVRAAVGTAKVVEIRQANYPSGGMAGAAVCVRGDRHSCGFGPVGVLDTTALRTVIGHPDPGAERALAGGNAIVLQHGPAGSVVDLDRRGPAGGRLPSVAVDPGVHGAYRDLPFVFVSPATAADHHWTVVPSTALVTPERLPSSDAVDRLQQQLGDTVSLYAERGYQSKVSVILLALIGAAAAATLAGTSIAVALAMAESRPDMATLAAVGAAPARRRLYAMGQAATVGGLGAALGIALGSLIAVSMLAGSSLYPTSVPFRWLVALAVGAPLLSVAVAGAVTRSKVTLTRRIA